MREKDSIENKRQIREKETDWRLRLIGEKERYSRRRDRFEIKIETEEKE